MKIWIDADACPLVIKNILYRAADRVHIELILVSNQFLQIPSSPYISKIKVARGFDVADNVIIDKMSAGDIVVTADIPLADSVVDKGGIALNPRGTLYSRENIKERLAIRNLNEELRSAGVPLRGVPKLNPREIQTFANCLDRLLSKVKN